jgi:hypothetical protein
MLNTDKQHSQGLLQALFLTSFAISGHDQLTVTELYWSRLSLD